MLTPHLASRTRAHRQPAIAFRRAAPAALLLAAAAGAAPPALPQFPSISADGSVVVFAHAGDLWAVRTGGTGGVSGPVLAQRLTAFPGDEGRSAFSPDGTLLALDAERDGPRNLYTLALPQGTTPSAPGAPLALGAVRRVTTTDRGQSLSAFSHDGRELWFTSSGEPSIYRSPRMYRVALPDPAASAPSGTPGSPPARPTRLTDAFGFSPRPTADGKGMLFFRHRLDATRPIYQGSGAPDLFSLDFATGTFTQLTTHARSDAEPFATGDGGVVYLSSRDGQFNLWRLPPRATDAAAAQLTTFKPTPADTTIAHGVRDLSVAPGGRFAVFCVWDTLYTLDLSAPGAAPKALTPLIPGEDAAPPDQRVAVGRLVRDAALSPDGKAVAVVARGEVFVRSTEKDRPTRRVTTTHAREGSLAWSPDGRILYFESDATGIPGIYAAAVTMTKDDLAKDTASAAASDATPAKPEPGADGNADAKPETKPDAKAEAKGDSKAPKKPDHGKRWADALTFTTFPVLVAGDALTGEAYTRPLPSPDGKQLLVTRGRGDLLVVPTPTLPTEDAALAKASPAPLAESAARLVFSCWNEPEVLWAGDARHVVFSAEDTNFNADVFLLDTAPPAAGAPANTPINLTRHPDLDHSPALSADGKVLVFLSDRDADTNGRDGVYAINLDRALDGLRPYELAEYYKDAGEKAKKRKPLGASADDTPAASPASSRRAATAKAPPAAKTPADPVPATAPSTEPAAPAEPAPASDPAGDDAPKDAKPAPDAAERERKPAAASSAPTEFKPFTFDADDAWRRVRRVVDSTANAGNLAITPAGDRILFTQSQEGSSTLVSVDYKGAERRTVASGTVSNVTISLTGDRVLYISAGEAALGRPTGGGGGGGGGSTASAAPTGGGGAGAGGGGAAASAAGGDDRMTIDATIGVDTLAQQRQKFLEAAHTIGLKHYHNTRKGLDWPALTTRYLSLAERVRTDSEFNRVFNFMLGELDSSHMGISGGRDPLPPPATVPVGRLGADLAAAPGGLRVARIIPGTPAERPALRTHARLLENDLITAVNGTSVLAPGQPDDALPTADPDALLLGTVGQETLLTVRRNGQPEPLTILLAPISAGADSAARYQDEVARNAAAVSTLSGGRLGYLHIRAMDGASVRDFERDLFAAADGKDGLVIDVRDNGGGATADILLSALTAPRHAYTAARGVSEASVPKDAYPRDRRLIYGYARPITVLINQNSFSNAEIFAHAIKTIGRGRLVGTATYGGVISTGGFTLIDGTTVRLPFRGWYLPNGTDMENNGATPDLNVPRTPQDEAAGKDAQLEAAVKDLLGRLG
jgi:tricorn protease